MARPLGSAGGGSGGGSVAWGDITGKPTRLGAFTASDETKLDGIQALAAVNPPHIVMAAFEDSDTDLGVQDGVIGLYESDNSLWQGGDPSDIANIQIAFRGATFGQDATNPGTDLTAVSRHQALFDDLIATGGTPFSDDFEAWRFASDICALPDNHKRDGSLQPDPPDLD